MSGGLHGAGKGPGRSEVHHHLLVTLHPIARELEPDGDGAVAVGPLVCAHAEGGAHVGTIEVRADIGEVVAQGRLGALDAHVIRVPCGAKERGR